MKTGLLRIKQEYIGQIAGFVIMGRVFTHINKRAGTVDGMGLSQHILKPSPQRGDSKGALLAIVRSVSRAKGEWQEAQLRVFRSPDRRGNGQNNGKGN
jgi:hypothetical protein